MTEKDAVRDSFTRITRILAKHSEEEQQRIIRAVAILLDYPDPASERPNGGQ